MTRAAGPVRSRPRGRAAILLVLAALALSGCAQVQDGTPVADAAGVAAVKQEQAEKARQAEAEKARQAEIEKQRQAQARLDQQAQSLPADCNAKRTELTGLLIAALNKGETDPTGAGQDVIAISRGQQPVDFGRTCGVNFPLAYSLLLIEVQNTPLPGPTSELLRRSMLSGLCKTDGKVVLIPEAQTVCNANPPN